MAPHGQPPGPVRPPRSLDDPAWFGAVMGSAATATVASLHPGRIDPLTRFADVTAAILLVASILAFAGLFVRDFLVRRLGADLADKLRQQGQHQSGSSL